MILIYNEKLFIRQLMFLKNACKRGRLFKIFESFIQSSQHFSPGSGKIALHVECTLDYQLKDAECQNKLVSDTRET